MTRLNIPKERSQVKHIFNIRVNKGIVLNPAQFLARQLKKPLSKILIPSNISEMNLMTN